MALQFIPYSQSSEVVLSCKANLKWHLRARLTLATELASLDLVVLRGLVAGAWKRVQHRGDSSVLRLSNV